MDTDTLKTFIEVVQAGSFAAAARQLDLDPSAVSRTVAALEAELGVRLFQRTTRRLAPTEAGAAYFERIRPVLDELERARAEAQDALAQPVGVLRVTASVTFGLTRLLPLLPALRAAHPALALDLLLTDATVDLIAERIDVAIRLGPSVDSSLIGRRLMTTRYRVCASPEYLRRHGAPVLPQELAQRDCLRFPLPGYRTRWKFRDRTGGLGEVDVHGSVVISNGLALLRAALDGLGPVLLPDWLIGEHLAHGDLVDLFPDHDVTATEFDTAAWLLYPSRSYMPLKLRAFIEFLQAQTWARRPRETGP